MKCRYCGHDVEYDSTRIDRCTGCEDQAAGRRLPATLPGGLPGGPGTNDDVSPLPAPTSDESIAKGMYGDRALSGPDSLRRSIKDWG